MRKATISIPPHRSMVSREYSLSRWPVMNHSITTVFGRSSPITRATASAVGATVVSIFPSSVVQASPVDNPGSAAKTSTVMLSTRTRKLL